MVERDSDKAIEHCKAAERQAGSKRKGLGTVSAKPNSCKAQGGNLATGAGGGALSGKGAVAVDARGGALEGDGVSCGAILVG